MKFTIKKSDVVDVLARIQGLTGRRSSLAITECVHIAADDGRIVISATDLETGYEGRFPAQVQQAGAIAVSARKFFEVLREFPSPEIVIDESEHHLINIGKQKVQFHLLSMNQDDFPPPPELDEVDLTEVPSAAFKKMIDKSVLISGVGEDKKPHINGVWLEFGPASAPQHIRMVSTDGSRLSSCDQPCTAGFAKVGGVLIPKKGLHESSKFLDSGGSVHIGLSGNYFIIKSPVETIHIRLLEGQFPKYEEIVFRTEGFPFTIQKDPLYDMLKRMSILCTDNYRAAIFRFDSGQLVINATNPDIGESKEDMAIDYSGEVVETAFNPKFFLDALNCVDDDKLVINMLSENKPCIIQGAEDKSYLGAIMPMRV